MTNAQEYLDRLFHEWQVWEQKLESLPENDGPLYRKYSSLVKTASTRYHAAKYMMQLMMEDVEND